MLEDDQLRARRFKALEPFLCKERLRAGFMHAGYRVDGNAQTLDVLTEVALL